MLDISKINNKISAIINQLLQKGRVDDEFIKSFYASYNQPTLQIGVVGKMKVGKSALINSVIFGNDVLPSSSEPVTVSLTKIFYGDKNTSTVEFLSQEDFNSLKVLANYSGDDPDQLLQKESAEEILANLPSNFQNILGKVITNVPNDELSKYVAADGEYCGLVKSVLMEINNDNLKGITIIDTPGFNDPVVTRGETTKEFLTDCHVVLFVHNSDGYDETDAALLNNQIEYAGVSKLVDVFNKMDTRKSLSLDGWKRQLEYFLEDREEYLSEDRFPYVYSLIKNSDAVTVSAFMALCGLRPKESRTEFIKNQIAKFEERYPELTEDESLTLEEALVKYSNIESIVTILNRIASNGKQYLIEKPLNTLIGKLNAIIELIQSDIIEAESDLNLKNQDRKSALSDLDGLKDFMKSIKESVTIAPMEVLLLDKVANTKTSICTQRESEKNSINKQKYPQPDIFSTGVTKANIAAYNIFLSRFQSILRGDFDSLSRNLESTANEYIRKTILSLINPKISEKRRNNFELKAKNKAKSKIQCVNIAIPAYSITTLPSGNAEQWSLLFTDFSKHYDDNAIDEFLQKYRDVSHDIGIPSFIIDMLLQMEEDMIRELSQSPAEIKEEINKVEERIACLKEELAWTKEQLQQLKNMEQL